MKIAQKTRLDHYEILSLLGAGGMGQVWRARDTRLNRKVAIKVLPVDFASDAERLRRFEQEALATSALNHPNILTVHDIGSNDGAPYIVAELLEGTELRALLKQGALPLLRSLDYAQQIAAGLAAAHEKGIIHRDLKPENLFVTTSGFVKILDFGLAKLRPSDAVPEVEAPTQRVITDPGAVMGTVGYMSPEQARGQDVDARSDIFSIGVVFYEMLAGRTPFAGINSIDVMGAILNQDPTPLRQLVPDVPRELEHLISKTLRKDREQRYQTSKDLLDDLNHLKEELTFAAKLKRSDQPYPNKPVTAQTAIFTTADTPTAITVSNTKVTLGEVKSHKRRTVLMLAAIALIAVVAAVFMLNRKPILTDKDTILLTEFENKTGDAVFDGTLRQGLAVQLQQSPFLDLFPEARVRTTLRLMSRSPDDRVTRESGREICQRQGLKALIAGSIAKFDHNYSITLEALNGQTGDVLAIVQVEAEGKDQVLKALSRAATQLREKLGESLSSIQKFDAPLEVTTSSLEALKEYALARDEQFKGHFLKAMEYNQLALEKDPNFATAWLSLATQYNNTGQPGRAAESAAKAFALRDRVSEDERARITGFYYSYVTGELDKAIEAQESYMRNYPRDHRGPGNLGNYYSQIGQTEKAVAVTREALRLNPNTAAWYGNLAPFLLRLNRLAEAEEVCRQAFEQKVDSTSIRGALYSLAFLKGDMQGMQEQLTWANDRPDEYRAVDWRTQTAAFAGEWRKSQEFFRHATELALRHEAKEVAAGYTAEQAMRAAWLGQFAQAVSLGEAALKLDRNRIVLTYVALALMLAGEITRAQPLMQELEQKHPKDTLVTQLWLPEIKAALELRKGNAQTALALLELTKRYEPAAEFWPQTLRGMAYLKLNKGAEAATEYQKILDHRGEAPLSLLWPFAELGLGQAASLQGDKVRAQQLYDEFFKLWKDADADLPVLIEAKKQYEKVK